MKYELELPAIPAGHDFAKDTFWHRYRARFANPRRYGWHIKQAAYEWFEREEKRAELNGEVFPPAPVFERQTRPVPQPWTGENEKIFSPTTL